MPPAAATVAGRRTTRPAATTGAPKAPRRVSGPGPRPEYRTQTRQRARPDVRPSARATAAATALEAQLVTAPARVYREAPARRAPTPRIPRDAPRRERTATRERVRVQSAPRLALRLQAPRLDRIVRGRAWIPVLGALLVAIVGLRVEVLKLGAGVGNEVQQATALESSNAALRSQISALSDNQRIVTLAAAYGMRMPNALDPHFLQASAGTHVSAAIRNVRTPDRQAFLAGLASDERTNQLSSQAGQPVSAAGAQTGGTTSAGAGGATPASAGTGGTTSGTGSSSPASQSTSTGGSAGTTTPAAGGTASGASGTAGSAGSTASSTGTSPSTGTAGTSSTATAGTSSAGLTSSGSTAPGSSSSGATAGGTTGGGTSAGGTVPGTSSTGLTSSGTPPAASTNGGSGLAG